VATLPEGENSMMLSSADYNITGPSSILASQAQTSSDVHRIRDDAGVGAARPTLLNNMKLRRGPAPVQPQGGNHGRLAAAERVPPRYDPQWAHS
jgi:hypothetical protein